MRNRIGTAALPLLALVAAFLASCAASVTMAPEADDAAAKQFMPPAGESSIYVVREDRFTGSAVSFGIQLDGVSVGSVAPGTFLMIPVAPGEHTVSSTTNENQEVRRVSVEAGRNYFFEIRPRMGWMSARVELEAVDESAGMDLVRAAKLAENLQAGP